MHQKRCPHRSFFKNSCNVCHIYIRLDKNTKTCLVFATVILEIIISVISLSGESLSDEEKDMEEDEKEDVKDVDEQDDDGFFVGHGVLDKNELKG